jgi:hypothetical protein
MKRILILGLTLIIFLISPAIIFAAAGYDYTVSLTNSGSDAEDIPISVSMPNQTFITAGKMLSSGLDTRVLDGETELPHLLVDNQCIFLGDIDENQTKTFKLTSGNSSLTSFPIMTGSGGYITIPDNATLEPGSCFQIDLDCYLKYSGYKLYKADSLGTYYDVDNSTVIFWGGDEDSLTYYLEATGIHAGSHVIRIIANGVTLSLYVDDMNISEDEQSITIPIPDNSNNWVLYTYPYINSLKISTAH